MKETVNNNLAKQMLFPYDPEQFWDSIRKIIREEVQKVNQQKSTGSISQTVGLTYKPLYEIADVCDLFQVTKPTIYDWVKHGKLKPYKIRSRVYFLSHDIQQLVNIKQL